PVPKSGPAHFLKIAALEMPPGHPQGRPNRPESRTLPPTLGQLVGMGTDAAARGESTVHGSPAPHPTVTRESGRWLPGVGRLGGARPRGVRDARVAGMAAFLSHRRYAALSPRTGELFRRLNSSRPAPSQNANGDAGPARRQGARGSERRSRCVLLAWGATRANV